MVCFSFFSSHAENVAARRRSAMNGPVFFMTVGFPEVLVVVVSVVGCGASGLRQHLEQFVVQFGKTSRGIAEQQDAEESVCRYLKVGDFDIVAHNLFPYDDIPLGLKTSVGGTDEAVVRLLVFKQLIYYALLRCDGRKGYKKVVSLLDGRTLTTYFVHHFREFGEDDVKRVLFKNFF